MTTTDLFSSDTYSVFDNSFDEVRFAADELKEVAKYQPELAENLKSVLLKRLEDVAEVEIPDTGDKRPVTFLLDCSGSMRGQAIFTLALGVIRVGDALAAQGRSFEVLGFTTRSWKGGKPWKLWCEGGRPIPAGRLCELLHIVFKSMDEPWEQARVNLSYALVEALLKENVDGESLAWAANRIIERAERKEDRGVLVLVSDGRPVDDRTLATNPASILADHLVEVKKKVQRELDLKVVSLFHGPGKEEDTAHPEAAKIYIEWGQNPMVAGQISEAITECISEAAPAPSL